MLISQPSIMIQSRSWITSTEAVCCALASLFPKLFCSGLHSWALYVLIDITAYQNLAVQFGSSALAWTFSVIGVVLYVLSLYTYFRVIVIGPGSPLDFAELRINNLDSLNQGTSRERDSGPAVKSSSATALMADIEAMEQNIGMEPDSPPVDYMISHNTARKQGRSGYKFCNKCSVWKPDRSHHCSASGKCILRMDHYCPWFSSCIGFRNQKLFIQFLWFSTLFSFVCFVATLWALWDFFKYGIFKDANVNLSINMVILFVVSLACFVSFCIFTGLQVYLVLRNLTTIEMSERGGGGHGADAFDYQFDYNGKKKQLGNIYDLGWRENWYSVMGHSWLVWVLPIEVTSSDITETYNNGINFKVDEEVYAQWVSNAELQNQLNQQLREYSARARR